MGIGKQLIRETIKLIENDSLLFLISEPSANDHYPRIGFKRIERAWYLEHNRISNENS